MTFMADWLALREPADRAARSTRLARLTDERLAGHDPLRVLDLGTGTGANLRFLAEHLTGAQQWTLVDRDAVLLRQVAQRVSSWGTSRGYVASGNAAGFGLRGATFDCRVETRTSDLSKLADPSIFEGQGPGHRLGTARPRLGPLDRGAGRRDAATPGQWYCSRSPMTAGSSVSQPSRRTHSSATSSTGISDRRRDSAGRWDQKRLALRLARFNPPAIEFTARPATGS